MTPPDRDPRPSRRDAVRLGLGAGLLAAAGADRAAAEAAPVAFTLLHVNDIYRMGEERGRGGFARLAAIVRAEREAAKGAGRPVLFTHAGDTLSPSLMSGFDRGAHIVELTNLVAPDVFVPGNHEFDFGPATFAQRMGEARFPVLAANMCRPDGAPVPGLRDTLLLDLGPLKVGIVGLALAETPLKSQPGPDLVFRDELETLREAAAGLRRAGAEFLVAVAHADRATDLAIVRSRLVDVLLSGHDHDLAVAYDGRTVMVESSEEGNFVTAIDVRVAVEGEGAARRVSWAPSFRVHDSSLVAPDPTVLAVVSRLEGELARELDVAIGTTETPLDSRTASVRRGETALGDLVADAVRTATGAEVGLVNGGGLRGNRLYPAGAVLTRRDVLSEMPFGNTTVLVAIPGRTLRALLEGGLSQAESGGGRFPQVSGLVLEADLRRAPGDRIVHLEVGGAPLDPERTYRVASNNFMLAGGDGYGALASGRTLIGATDGKLVANEVMAYIRRLGTVAPRVEGRIVLK